MTQAPQVLVVDDSQSIRQAVRGMLEPHGYQVREATDGDEGLEAIRAESDPMIVLLDYQMERMDGGEVLKTVASEGGPLLNHEYIMISAVAHTFPPATSEASTDTRSGLTSTARAFSTMGPSMGVGRRSLTAYSAVTVTGGCSSPACFINV